MMLSNNKRRKEKPRKNLMKLKKNKMLSMSRNNRLQRKFKTLKMMTLETKLS